MKKKANQITNFKYYLPYFIRGIIAFFILLALTLLIYFFELNTPMTTISLLDGLLIATVIGFATSLFTYLVYSGSLNFVSYGFSTFGSIFNKNVNKKYKDLKEYNEIKKIERAGKTYYFLSYIIVSSLYLIALIVVFILFNTGVIL
ncbi:MAG: DUF3899 domain-containing protein [Candidatus Onthovivens sp.]|nr:DUF3899 domain-containing protein [Candidatus Onthovivens sp.]MDY3761873.1 DUF3899 domain-containing protein [Candidatus Onthovivens sp.]MDY4823387.1 DUF3899 domain-containing protein [Candidatus Onthovivens sp.]MDY5928420.1 DUF3899 domain-containing protein [Candidatus Onthovivens sp.]